jgi:large subunit ribosomal protein LX
MTAYVVSGRMPGRDGDQPFETEIEAPNESVAREHAYATLGGRHGHNRAQVDIEAISDEVDA